MTSQIQRALVRALAIVAFGALGFGVGGCAGNEGAPCDPECMDFELCCDGACILASADANNCGGCGVVCPSGVCRAGTCEPGGGMDGSTSDSGGGGGMCGTSCNDTGDGATHRCCGGTCIPRAVPQGTDGTSDPSFANCNGCGIGCNTDTANSCSVPGGGTGMARCMCGDFNACGAGEVCINEGGTYMCISTSTDPRNCGMIGHECAPGETCLGGNCVCGGSGAACGMGEACCAGTCTPVQNDPMNCGGCGVVCGPNADGCSNGMCTCGSSPACREATPPSGGFPIPIPIPGAGSSGDPGQLCCTGACVEQDETNCGMCGFACGMDETCGVATPLLGGPAEVCCLEEGGFGGFLGCGSGGFPFPFPDGGLGGDGGFAFDGGI